MQKFIYKTEEGRNLVESSYQNVLKEHSFKSFDQLFIDTEAGKTHVLKFGDTSKPPLVMIHGTASNSAAWLGNIQDFSDQFCVYCVDIPGEPGLSIPYRHSLVSDAPYKWLNSLLNKLTIETVSFVTISLGSWYALNFAIQSPQRVKSISMLTTPGIVPAKKSFILKAILFMMLGKCGQKLLNKSIYHKTEVPNEVLEFQYLVSKHFIPLFDAIPIFTNKQLKKITAATQYFGGDHDSLINSVKTGKRLKNLLPTSEINILKDTGHVIIDQFSAIKEFLR